MFGLNNKWIVLGWLLTAMVAMPAYAVEFRVDSKIFEGDQDRPVSESSTLFHNDKVYDSLSSPPEITVLDLSNRNIVVLDPTRKIYIEFKTSQITEFVNQLRVRASRQADQMLKFAAAPNFTETVDDNGSLTFASPLMTYRIRGTRANDPAVSQAYREFADWTAQLQTCVKQGARPPFPRLHVNSALERRGLLPDVVELTLAQPNRPNAKPVALRSQHTFKMELYPADRKLIDEYNEYAKKFELVTLEQYLRPPQQARR